MKKKIPHSLEILKYKLTTYLFAFNFSSSNVVIFFPVNDKINFFKTLYSFNFSSSSQFVVVVFLYVQGKNDSMAFTLSICFKLFHKLILSFLHFCFPFYLLFCILLCAIFFLYIFFHLFIEIGNRNLPETKYISLGG